MHEFKIEGDALRREARFRVLSWGGVLLLLVATVLIFALGVSGDLRTYPGLSWVFLFTSLGTVIGAIVLAFREALHLAERQMVFVLDDSGIVRRRKGYADVAIAFSEVESVSEELGQLIIKSREPGKTIVIPNNVNGYEMIRAELAKHYALSTRAKKPRKSTGLLIACVLSWAAVMWSHDVRVVIPAAAAGLIFLAFGSHRMWNLLRRNSPGWLLWGSIGAAWLMAILLIYLRVVRF